MDSAHSHPICPSPAPNPEDAPLAVESVNDPTLHDQPSQTKTSPETASSRQHRLLHNRNARFAAKKLSLSNLGARFTQLIHANEELRDTSGILAHQKNDDHRSKENLPFVRDHFSTASLSILDDWSSTRGRRTRRSGGIAVYQDTPERPLLERSPFSSPAIYQELSSEGPSPLGLDDIKDHLGNMRLREISGNEHRGSLFASSPLGGSVKGPKKRHSLQIKAGFDTQEYINHIERELQEAKNEMFSPTTNRSLKDQLKTARLEKERMRKEMADLRDAFETEMKRTLEQKTTMEVEWRRKVRDLEEDLDQKVSVIKDLELHHDEKRLDGSTIDTLKAAIERLEQEKTSLEDENRSVSKRNEVLSELLAMSPTKNQQFELRSPVREKRPGRPMSMILPRPAMSPNTLQASQPASALVSPVLSAGGPFFTNLSSSLEAAKLFDQVEALCEREQTELPARDATTNHIQPDQASLVDPRSRRSTLQSQSSSNPSTWSQTRDASPHDDPAQRCLPKRKPRRFVAGSTQLKPLLLPALTGDTTSQPTSSVISTPPSSALRDSPQESIDPTTCFLSKSGDTASVEGFPYLDHGAARDASQDSSEDTVIAYETFDEILAEHGSVLASDRSEDAFDGADSQIRGRSLVCPQLSEPVQQDPPTGQTRGLSLNQSSQQSVAALCIDTDALNRLDLPEAHYEPFRIVRDDLAGQPDMDVPQPLFSPLPARGDSTDTAKAWSKIQYNPQLGRSRSDLDVRDISRVNRQQSLYPYPAVGLRNFVSFSSSPSSVRSELPQRSALNRTEPLARTKSSLELLRQGQFGARPLASLAIRTLYGTISRCATYMFELKRDPLALARRILANAWLYNWTRCGRLSWWVLGLFISPSIGGPKVRKWDWDQYDGEAITQAACESNELESAAVPAGLLVVSQHQSGGADCASKNTQMTSPRPGWGRSIFLWGKFSVAIMLAVGGAVVKGPGEMLKELDDRSQRNAEDTLKKESSSRRRPRLHRTYQSYDTFSNGSPMIGHLRSTQATFERDYPQTSPSRVRLPSTQSFGPSKSRYSESDALFDRFRQLQRGHHHTNEDDTLRPVKSPRPHVAAIFRNERTTFTEDDGSSGQLFSSNRAHRSVKCERHSIDDGAMQWPPSPGPIYPEDSSSVRRDYPYQDC